MNSTKITFRGLTVWLVCASFFMYEFLLRTVLGTFQEPIMAQLHLTPVTFALLSSTAYQLIYSLMQIPVGLVTERYGLKKTLLAAVMVCVIADIGFSLASSFYVAITLRVLMGFGSSFGFVCLLVAVYDWMPRKNIALFIGLSQLVGTLGPMLAAGPLNMLAENSIISWRGLFGNLAAIGLGIAVLVLLVVDKNKENTTKSFALTKPTPVSKLLYQFIYQKQIWFIAVYSAFVYFSLEYLSENECKAFLVSKGFSVSFSGYMITLGWIGYAFGCAILGFISDKIQRRKVLMLLGALAALLALTGIVYLPLNKPTTALCFFFLGIGASGQSIGFAIMAEQCRENHLAIGLGFNNAMIGFFSAINAPLIGFFLSNANSTATLNDYQHAFFIMIAFLITAVILAGFFIKETFCKSMRENTLLIRPMYNLNSDLLKPE
ncbi:MULTISPECIES: MFS transporter [unclassified Legionella]|uniref:MFS transporter n=1 Tax=unclassified Legionella TaxID=2622702 RepID=UPI001F5F7FA0|nr:MULTISPECIES: MFS transporter [unclassified Legionella]MDI9819241.1 MFS transporter [Legionella sp. PL877]